MGVTCNNGSRGCSSPADIRLVILFTLLGVGSDRRRCSFSFRHILLVVVVRGPLRRLLVLLLLLVLLQRLLLLVVLLLVVVVLECFFGVSCLEVFFLFCNSFNCLLNRCKRSPFECWSSLRNCSNSFSIDNDGDGDGDEPDELTILLIFLALVVVVVVLLLFLFIFFFLSEYLNQSQSSCSSSALLMLMPSKRLGLLIGFVVLLLVLVLLFLFRVLLFWLADVVVHVVRLVTLVEVAVAVLALECNEHASDRFFLAFFTVIDSLGVEGASSSMVVALFLLSCSSSLWHDLA